MADAIGTLERRDESVLIATVHTWRAKLAAADRVRGDDACFVIDDSVSKEADSARAARA